jgi:hypothetical protein
MKDFIHTGWWMPTQTTSNDPLLKAIEIDNGYTWTIKFYVRDILIDCIDMEHLNGSEIHDSVKSILVYDEDGTVLGNVIDRLRYASEYSPLNSMGLRYINEEVGYVDQDEEYY